MNHKASIFVTGVAGSGKSTITKTLNTMGYTAHDIEDYEYGLFMMVRKDNGEQYMDYDNADLEKVNNARWICDISKLRELIDKQADETAFYCGIASNNKEVMPLFNTSVLLKVDPKLLDERLVSREGTDGHANTEAGRRHVLSWKEEFEKEMEQLGMMVIDANGSPEEVASRIIELVRS